MTFAEFLKGVLVPVLFAATGAGLGWRIWKRDAGPPRALSRSPGARLGTSFGLIAGFAAASVAVNGWPPGLVPSLDQSVSHWFVYIAALSAVFVCVRCARRWLPGTRAFGTSLACTSVSWILISPLRRNDVFDSQSFLMWLIVIAAGLIVMAAALDGLSRRARDFSGPGVLAVLALVTAPCLVLWTTVVYAKVAGALCAMACVWVVYALWRRRFALTHGPASVFALLLGTCMATSFVYGDAIDTPAKRVSAAMLVGASLAWMVGDVPLVRRKLPSWGVGLVRIGAVGVVALVALIVTASVSDVGEYLRLAG